MASLEEINRAARAVAATVVTQPQELRIRIGELASLGAFRMKQPRFPGAMEDIYAVLAAHPEGVYAGDVYSGIKDKYPGLQRQGVFNMLSRMQMKGNAKNLGKGSGLWGPGPVVYGKVSRTYKARAALAKKRREQSNGAARPDEPMAVLDLKDMEMAIQNMRVSLADLEKVVHYVVQQKADIDAKADKVAKALAALA